MNYFHKTIIVLLLCISSLSRADTKAENSMVLSHGAPGLSLHKITAKRILMSAYSKIGISLKFEELPGERSLLFANNGDTDGELVRIGGIQDKYPNLIQIPISIGYDKILVYSKKYYFKVQGWKSLKPYKIDYMHGFKLAEQKTKDMDTEMVKKVDQGLKKLIAGRSDLFIGSVGFQCSINKLNLPEIKALNPPIDTVVLFHYLHKRHKDMAEKLETVLKQMKESGEMKLLQEQSKLDFLSKCK